jgi:large subunit ribosomal protein L31
LSHSTKSLTITLRADRLCLSALDGGKIMKTGIHPEYVPATISCACGEVIRTRSTVPVLKVEICSKCHPLFTGRQKLIDSEGRVERFQRKYGRKPAASEAGKAGA